MRIALAFGFLLVASAAEAGPGPTGRFGLTFAVADQGAPLQNQFGPMAGIGVPVGPIVLEVDYAFLSFMEGDVLAGGMHRFGVNARTNLFRYSKDLRFVGQVGAAMRYGQWHIDANTVAPAHTDRQREAHVELGAVLDNPTVSWLFGLRLAAAPRDDLMLACRGTGCESMRAGGTDLSLLVEWTFIFGR